MILFPLCQIAVERSVIKYEHLEEKKHIKNMVLFSDEQNGSMEKTATLSNMQH